MTTMVVPAAPSPDFLLNGSNPFREAMSRDRAQQATIQTPGTGIAMGNAVAGYAGDVVTNITVRTGTTAANGPTHFWLALYDPAGNLIGQTADQGSNPIAASTIFTLPLVGGPFVLSTTGVHYVVILVTVTVTMPFFTGWAAISAAFALAAIAGQKPLSVVGASGLTTTASPTLSLATGSASRAYVLLS